MYGKKGFTLIEIVITCAVLSLIIIPIGTFFSQSSNLNKKSKYLTLGTVIAQDKIEGLKAFSFRKLSKKYIDNEEIMSNGVLFMRKTSVEAQELNLLIITVEVFWDGGEVKLVTYRGDY